MDIGFNGINISILFTSFTIAITPGIANLLSLMHGANFDLKKTWHFIAGLQLGVLIVFILTSLFLNVIFNNYLFIFKYIKILGICYMVYLSIRIMTAEPFNKNDKLIESFSLPKSIIIQIANGKLWMASLALLSAYSNYNNYWLSICEATIIFMVVCSLSNIFWFYTGKYLSGLLYTDKRQRIFFRTIACLMLISLISLI